VLIASDGEAADAPAVVPTAISAATYWPRAPGGALCRPHQFDGAGEAVNDGTVAW